MFLSFSDPNGDGLTHWPKYSIDSKLYVNLNKDSITLGANVHKDNIKLLLETIPNQSKVPTKTELWTVNINKHTSAWRIIYGYKWKFIIINWFGWTQLFIQLTAFCFLITQLKTWLKRNLSVLLLFADNYITLKQNGITLNWG